MDALTYVRFALAEEDRAALVEASGGRLGAFVRRALGAALGRVLAEPRIGRPPKPRPPKAEPPKAKPPPRERTDDPARRTLLPGMPEEARSLPWREYTRVRRRYRFWNEEAARRGVTVEELAARRAEGRRGGWRPLPFANAETARAAQARSVEVRRARTMERFAALVPEALRARYAGHEARTMKNWRREARRNGIVFEEYVSRLMAKRLATGNPGARAVLIVRDARDWDALLALVPAGFREPYEKAGRLAALKAAIRWRSKHTGVSMEEAARLMGTRRAMGRANGAAHPWHGGAAPAVAAVAPASAKEEPRPSAALASLPPPAQTKAASRWRNCQTCARGGLFRCLVWPVLQATEALVCPYYSHDRVTLGGFEE